MASIINASSSGSGGIVQTADASGVLQLQSNGTVAVNILSGTSIAVGSATAYNGGGFGSNMSIYGSTAAAITVVNATEQFQIGANSANNLGFYNPTHATYMAAMNQYGIGVGDAVPSSGFGITFPATQSASSNANTLDDYEEGTFTPTYIGSTGNPTMTYGQQIGSYIKVGSLVYFTIRLYTTARTGGSGFLSVGGLPFTATGTSGSIYSLAQGFMYLWSTTPAASFINNGANTVALYSSTTSNAQSLVSELPNSACYYGVSGCYQVN